ncbi:GlxA family transcriptional regulator [Xanthovirga aplysinae]|uniref:GlxA family transcriptional regulator n=1 Tax=Xanthovirga aplysinae TaxID=2529853 RepID=UPI0012BC4FF1|nr:DJ-1/PfpI family protein [Xanthovirga aplysinae]MTI29666.1 helix-turn-helix domain-containing protein [Xanthovirga aplysinae]
MNKALKNILFIIPSQVHLLDVNGPAHIFYEAKEFGAAINLHFVSMDENKEVHSSAGLIFSKLIPFHQFELDKNDFVFVPGLDYRLISDEKFIEEQQGFSKWLKKQYANGANICSVCTGAFLLAEAEILNGKNCTTHWKYLSKLSQKYPEVVIKKNRLFVVQDNLYSSAGVSSGIDLALYIIEEQFGTKMSTEVAREVVIYLRRTESDPQLSIFLQYRNHLNSRIHQAQDYLTKHLSNPININQLAEQVNMSERNLSRLFKKTTGITIGTYHEKLRIDKALHLFSEGHKVEFVTHQCGLKSSNQLRALLKKHQGLLPSNIISEKD